MRECKTTLKPLLNEDFKVAYFLPCGNFDNLYTVLYNLNNINLSLMYDR